METTQQYCNVFSLFLPCNMAAVQNLYTAKHMAYGVYRLAKRKMSCYNHGQKSWDKFTFVALFHTRQTNSHARIHRLNLFNPSPLQCWTRVHPISPEFQHCRWGRGGGARIFKRITVLFENSVLKTQTIYAFTQVSQGPLSRIVGSFHLCGVKQKTMKENDL